MPQVTQNELRASFTRYFEGRQPAALLANHICAYALPSENLLEKRFVLQLMHEFKARPTFRELTRQLQRKLQFPRSYNWKDALYGNAPHTQHCIDTRKFAENSATFETSQQWLPGDAPASGRSFACLQSKFSLQQIAMISQGDSTAFCIATSQSAAISSKMARRTGKHLVRLFNQAKTAQLLFDGVPVVMADTASFIEDQDEPSCNVYGIVMRVFADQRNPQLKKVVFVGIGNCDLLLLKSGAVPTLNTLVTAKEQFENPIGFLSEGFRVHSGMTLQLMSVSIQDVFIFTTPPALAVYEQSPMVERRVGKPPGEGKLPPREMRLSQDDLRILNDSSVLAYAHNYDVTSLMHVLTMPLPICQNMLIVAKMSFLRRNLAIHEMIKNLKSALELYLRVPDKHQALDANLIHFFNWLDTCPHKQLLLTKSQVNCLLYYMGYECVSSSEIKVTILQAICEQADALPRMPPFGFVVRYPENIALESCAVLEMAYDETTRHLEKLSQAPLRVLLQDSKILSQAHTLFALKRPAGQDKQLEYDILLQFRESIHYRYTQIEELHGESVSEILNRLLILLFEILQAQLPIASSIQIESRTMLLNIEAHLFKSYHVDKMGHDKAFAFGLRMQALGQNRLPCTGSKEVFLANANLLPQANTKLQRDKAQVVLADPTGLSPLDQMLELWLQSQACDFQMMAELQQRLHAFAEQKYAFAYYLQALLLFHQYFWAANCMAKFSI